MKRRDKIRISASLVVGVVAGLLTGDMHATGLVLMGFAVGGMTEVYVWTSDDREE